MLFRKAKALGELGFFEKAEKILDDLLKKEDSGKYFGIPGVVVVKLTSLNQTQRS